MKKWLIIEIVVLVVLLAVAVMLHLDISALPAVPTDVATTGQTQTEPVTTAPEQTETEPAETTEATEPTTEETEPSVDKTETPTEATKPTTVPTEPETAPTTIPTEPETVPTTAPTTAPTTLPTEPETVPTTAPTTAPTTLPTEPETVPTTAPTTAPTTLPTEPETAPTTEATTAPTTEATTAPTTAPTTEATTAPTTAPTAPPADDETKPALPEATWMKVPADRKLSAKKAFVYDVAAEEFTYLLGEKTDKIYPASITKLVTVYVALQYLKLDQQVVVNDVLSMLLPGSSVAGINRGNVLTVEMLVQALVLPSGNDAAYILADTAGRVIAKDDTISSRDAVAAFVKEMNNQASALGMTGSHFTSPDGYHDSEHYTTCGDIAIVIRKVMQLDVVMKYVRMTKGGTTFISGQTRNWENTNLLLDPNSRYYCSIATGMKTGRTQMAGSCLIGTFNYGGKEYVIGVFGCAQREDRFDDALQLLNMTLGIE